MNRYLQTLIASFTLSAAAGCAPALHDVNLSTCMQSDQHATNVPLLFNNSSRKDTFNDDCATARAAEVISKMKRADGSPDMPSEIFALKFYKNSNPKIRDFMDQMLKERGLTADTLAFTLQQQQDALHPLACIPIEIPDGTTEYRCKVKTPPAAAAPVPKP